MVTLVSAVLAFSRRPLLEAATNREPGVFFGVHENLSMDARERGRGAERRT